MSFEPSDKEFLQRVFLAMTVWLIIRVFGEAFLLGLHPFFQFVVGTFAMYAFPSVLLMRYLKWDWRKFVGATSLLAAFDLISIPTLVSTAGEFTGQGVFLGTGTIDNMFFLLFQPFLSGILLFLAVYAIGFVALMALATFLLTEKQLTELVL